MPLTHRTPILVTGATGFVGSYLCRHLLAAGYTQVYAQRRTNSRLDMYAAGEADQLQWREADLLDYFAVEDLLKGIEVVIHCAAKVSFQAGDKAQLLSVNRDGTTHVVNAALHQGVKRLIHLSSVAALGRNKQGQAISEESKWENGSEVSNYSLSKFLADTEVWRGQAEGLSVAALYPTIILGAGRWAEGSVKIIGHAASAPRYYPSGATGIVDVRDVAKAVRMVLERNVDGDRFLLNGTNVSYRELFAGLAQAFGHAPPDRALAKGLAMWAARLDSWRTRLLGGRPLLTPETVRTSYRNHQYDNSRSGEVLGMEYRALEETLADTVAIWRQTEGEGAGTFSVDDPVRRT